jgi:hypothetical protein
MALLPIRLADVITRLVGDHNPAVECVELEIAILPSFLFPSEVVREETFELVDRGGLRGGERGRVRRASRWGRHRDEFRLRCVMGVLEWRALRWERVGWEK